MTNLMFPNRGTLLLLLATSWGWTVSLAKASEPALTNAKQEIAELQWHLQALKTQLTERQKLLQQSVQLQDDVTRGPAELANLREKLADRQQLNQTLTQWTKASFFLGDNRSSHVLAIRESPDAWTVTAIATRPFLQYALVAAINAGVPRKEDTADEALLKQVLMHRPANGSVPFVVRPSQLSHPEPNGDVTPSPPMNLRMTEPRQPAANEPRQSVETYQLVVINSNTQESPVVLATAFPISRHCFATSGCMLSTVANFPALASSLVIRRNADDAGIRVRNTVIHPGLLEEIRKQTPEREKLGLQIKRLAGTGDLQPVQTRLAALDAAIAVFDLGILEVDQPIASVWPINERPLETEEPTCVHGWPMTSDHILLPGSSPRTSSGNLVFVNAKRPLQIVTSSGDQSIWNGSPVVDRDGYVRGICSCPITLYGVQGERRFHVVSISQLATLTRNIRH